MDAHLGLWADAENSPAGNFNFRGGHLDIRHRSTDEPIEIALLHDIPVEQDIVEKTEMRELLDDVRSAAAKADDADDTAFDELLRTGTEK